MTTTYTDDQINNADLTDRERDVLRLRNEGKSDVEIGQALGVATTNQIGNYRRNAEVKLGLRDGTVQGSGRKRGPSVPKVADPNDTFAAMRATFDKALEAAKGAVDDATKALDAFDPKTAKATIKSGYTDRAAKLRAEADALDAKAKGPVSDDEVNAMRTALADRVEAAKAGYTTAKANHGAAVKGLNAAIKALG